jgi:hypothetical protein
VRSGGVVLVPEAVGEVPSLREGREELDVQQLVCQLAVEALDVSVLPGAAGLDGERSYPAILTSRRRLYLSCLQQAKLGSSAHRQPR